MFASVDRTRVGKFAPEGEFFFFFFKYKADVLLGPDGLCSNLLFPLDNEVLLVI